MIDDDDRFIILATPSDVGIDVMRHPNNSSFVLTLQLKALRETGAA